jgi:signal transduction histidine kinase
LKIIHKSYLLVGILITAAAVNLYLLYETEQEFSDRSYAIIRAAELKVNLEKISALTKDIGSSDEKTRKDFENATMKFEKFLADLEPTIPDYVLNQYENVTKFLKPWTNKVNKLLETSVLSADSFWAKKNILDLHSELFDATDKVDQDLKKEIPREAIKYRDAAVILKSLTKNIHDNTADSLFGTAENATTKLIENKDEFDKNFQILFNASVNRDAEGKPAIPQENSESIRNRLSPIWEKTKFEIDVIQTNLGNSSNFDFALYDFNTQTNSISDSFDVFLNDWATEKINENSQRGTIVQSLLVVDIAVFLLVIVIIRQSLNPLAIISKGMARMKEGFYGEKINYKSDDEIGELVDTFNVMSETIKQKTEEAEATDIAKDEFLSMITHELKTPLVPIQGYVDILLGEHLGPLTEKQKERLKIIKNSSESLLRIISDLLDAQKLELGKLVIKKENHNIKETIDNAVKALQPRAIENKVIIKQNLDKEIILPYDPERIMQVLTNLLKNSLDAVEPNTGVIEITVEDLPQEVMIRIKDNGPGIPKEKQDELFNKFYQVDTSLTREIGGSGLGLAICKGLVEQHGGKIDAQSTPGAGATFSFTLPKSS